MSEGMKNKLEAIINSTPPDRRDGVYTVVYELGRLFDYDIEYCNGDDKFKVDVDRAYDAVDVIRCKIVAIDEKMVEVIEAASAALTTAVDASEDFYSSAWCVNFEDCAHTQSDGDKLAMLEAQRSIKASVGVMKNSRSMSTDAIQKLQEVRVQLLDELNVAIKHRAKLLTKVGKKLQKSHLAMKASWDFSFDIFNDFFQATGDGVSVEDNGDTLYIKAPDGHTYDADMARYIPETFKPKKFKPKKK